MKHRLGQTDMLVCICDRCCSDARVVFAHLFLDGGFSEAAGIAKRFVNSKPRCVRHGWSDYVCELHKSDNEFEQDFGSRHNTVQGWRVDDENQMINIIASIGCKRVFVCTSTQPYWGSCPSWKVLTARREEHAPNCTHNHLPSRSAVARAGARVVTRAHTHKS